MGWFSNNDGDKPKPDGDKPWNKPLSKEALDKLRKGIDKKDPGEKDQNNPPKKGGWW